MVLRQNGPGHFDSDIVPTPLATLHHDTVVNSLILKSEDEDRNLRIETGPELRRQNGGQKSQIPDAVITFPDSGRRIAVELELTQKSDTRYREIILEYQLSRIYDGILYVVGSPAIETKIKRVILQAPNVNGLPSESFRPFSFLPLPEALSARSFWPSFGSSLEHSNVVTLSSKLENRKQSEVKS